MLQIGISIIPGKKFAFFNKTKKSLGVNKLFKILFFYPNGLVSEVTLKEFKTAIKFLDSKKLTFDKESGSFGVDGRYGGCVDNTHVVAAV